MTNACLTQELVGRALSDRSRVPSSNVFISSWATIEYERLLSASIEENAWFRNADGRLVGCVYTPSAQELCEGGQGRNVEFTSGTEGWKVSGTAEILCMHDTPVVLYNMSQT